MCAQLQGGSMWPCDSQDPFLGQLHSICTTTQQMFIMGYSAVAGAAERLLLGSDSFGNVCGKRNSPVEGASLSGQDMTLKKHVFFMNSCNLDIKDRKLGSTALCVSSCPEEQLNTLEEVQLFANTTVVCGILWWLYYDYTNDLSIELDTEKENMTCVLGFAVVSTVITAFLLVLIFVLRKRIKLTVEIFQVANKVIRSSPFLLFQPLWTFTILIFFWIFWVAVLLSLGTAGVAQVIEGGQVEYKPLSGIRYLWWYHLIGLIWTSEFILACQQMTIAGAVVTCYFNRNKNDPPDHPILSSLSILFCYHQGTVVKGSFLITVTRIPRTILMCIYDTLKAKNAYTATAINGTDFCTSAKDALKIASKNSSHFAPINYFGDFMIFLGKVLVVCFTVFGGLMAFNYNRVLQVWTIPLLLVTFFAYLVAHSFLSVFETVLDALFLCFAVDLETNDGSSEKPYLMDQDFLVSEHFILCRNLHPHNLQRLTHKGGSLSLSSLLRALWASATTWPICPE
ncbi:Choline transporter-like protein 3 [Sciurus carolinensis]|uniref:Choline transporter-like protein n=1 Tax=Sciurus carolinensis TaxID=30640 RepID=A0AA41N5T7_SCICA|nr:Choline transporter-like protein 3 [Sciurus carolinensis]